MAKDISHVTHASFTYPALRICLKKRYPPDLPRALDSRNRFCQRFANGSVDRSGLLCKCCTCCWRCAPSFSFELATDVRVSLFTLMSLLIRKERNENVAIATIGKNS